MLTADFVYMRVHVCDDVDESQAHLAMSCFALSTWLLPRVFRVWCTDTGDLCTMLLAELLPPGVHGFLVLD